MSACLRDQTRAEVIGQLRHLLPRLEGISQDARVLAFGIPGLDRHLPQGGLALGALHEILPATAADLPAAAFAFVAALLGRVPPGGPLLLVTSPRGLGCGRPYGHGLGALGLDPARVILVEAADDGQALWAMEEALRSGAPAAVAGTIGAGLDLKASQKLQLAARLSGVPLLLLRPAAAMQASAAVTRWRIGPAPAARDDFGLVTRWRWRVHLDRCRNGRPGEWMLEWDHGAHRFCLAAALAGPALPGGAGARLCARSGRP